MADLHDDDGALVATDTFSMDCPTCGPGTVQFLDGEMVPHGCDYRPPSLVIDCSDDDHETCSWCGGDGLTECDDPIQCCDSTCDGEICPCKACDGRGYDQWIW